MSTKPHSLNGYIPVAQLLDLLDCRPALCGLPLKTRCPVCRDGILTVYWDAVCGGGWHRCSECRSHGDMIALAAAALKVSLEEAIAHLAFRGFSIPTDDASIRRYRKDHVEYDARLNRLWESAQTRNRSMDPYHAGIIHRLGLKTDRWPANWPIGFGQCFGGLTKTLVEKAFAPEVMSDAVSSQSGSTSAHRTFRGKEWEHLLAVPFYDQFGRIASFLFIGRDADPQRDFVLRRANRGVRGNQHVSFAAEAGLAMHPDIFNAADDSEGVIFTIGDPIVMLKLQAKQFQAHNRPLPLAAWVDSDQWPHWQTMDRRTRTHAAWQMCSGYKTIFWCPFGINVYVLRQAIAADGWICSAGPQTHTPKALDDYLQRTPQHQLFRRLIDQAVPWPEAVRKFVEKSKDPVVERLLIHFEQQKESLEPILSRCGPHVEERISLLRNTADRPRTIQFSGRTIVEGNQSWSVQQNGRPTVLICDAILRVDRILTCEETRRHLAKGRVLYHSQELPFCVPLEQLEKDAFGLMKDLVLSQASGMLRVDRQYSRRLLQIAIAFRPPLRAEPLRRVGLDRAGGQLTVPNFVLEPGGMVRPKVETIVPGQQPASCLTLPAQLGPPQIDALTAPFESAKVLWATTASVLANIFASEFGEHPAGTCLVGQGARSVGMAVAEALGCLRLPLKRVADVETALEAESTHDWPIVFDQQRVLPVGHRRKLLGLNEEGRRCILGVESLTGKLMVFHEGWNVIEYHEPLAVEDGALQAATAFLTSYLVDLMGRHCHLSEGGNFDALPLRFLEDMADFFESIGGDPAPVLQAEELFAPGSDIPLPNAFLRFMGELMRAGFLTISDPGIATGVPALVFDPGRGGIFVDYPVLRAALHHIAGPPLSPIAMDNLLTLSGYTRGLHYNRSLLDAERVIGLWRSLKLLPDELEQWWRTVQESPPSEQSALHRDFAQNRGR